MGLNRFICAKGCPNIGERVLIDESGRSETCGSCNYVTRVVDIHSSGLVVIMVFYYAIGQKMVIPNMKFRQTRR